MRLTGKLALFALLAIVLTGCRGLAGSADTDFPTKPITYLSTFAPGGGSDRLARREQPHLEKALGQKVTIEYKEGAGGAVGWAEAARAKPDGYSLSVITLPNIIVQPMLPDPLYKTEDLVPVAIIQGTPLVLAVPNSSPYRSLPELLDAAKANPGKVTIGGTGTFTAVHLATLRLQKAAGVTFEYVSFSGGAQQTSAFLGGQVAAIIVHTGDYNPYKESGRLLATTTEERFFAYPDVPTFKEQGVDLVQYTERGPGVPVGTPDPVIRKLEKAFLEVAKLPEVVEGEKSEGNVTLSMGHDAAKKYLAEQTTMYRALLAEVLKK